MEDIRKVLQEGVDLRNRVGDIQRAKQIFERIYKKTRRTEPYFSAVAEGLATLNRDLGNTREAWKLYNLALKSARKHKDRIRIADTLRSMSFLAIFSKGLKKAQEYINQAMRVIGSEKSKEGLKVKVGVYAVLGNIQYTKRNYKRAMTYYLAGLKLARKLRYVERIITISGDISNVYAAREEFERADVFLNSVMRSAKKHYKKSVAQFYIRFARLKYEQGKRNAVNLLNKTIQISEKEGWKVFIAESSSILADISDDPKEKRKYWRKASSIFKKLGYAYRYNEAEGKLKKLNY